MYVRVDACAGAKREEVIEQKGGRLSISVREPARQNLANRRIATLVAAHYGVSPRAVRLVAGHRSPKKVFAVDSISQ